MSYILVTPQLIQVSISGTTIYLSNYKTLIWNQVPGSSTKFRRKRILFFPGRYDAENILEELVKLPTKNSKYVFDITSIPLIYTKEYTKRVYTPYSNKVIKRHKKEYLKDGKIDTSPFRL